MKYELDNQKLKIYLEGEINSDNSEDAEKEINSILTKESFKSIVLDFEKMNYVSSAGIRIILKIKKQYDDLFLIKVPDMVFDIFDMVGLPNVIKIEKL